MGYEIATPTSQQVLETRRLNAERGLEPFDLGGLRGDRVRRRRVDLSAFLPTEDTADAPNTNPATVAVGEIER